MTSLGTIFGFVIVYVLLSHIIKQLNPAISFYFSTAFVIFLLLISIPYAVQSLLPIYREIPESIQPIINGFIFTLLGMLSIEWITTYMKSLNEELLGSLLHVLIKISIVQYWFQLFWQMR